MSEIRKDIELARSRDAAKAETLEAWLNEEDAAFGDRTSHSIAPHPTNGAA